MNELNEADLSEEISGQTADVDYHVYPGGYFQGRALSEIVPAEAASTIADPAFNARSARWQRKSMLLSRLLHMMDLNNMDKGAIRPMVRIYLSRAQKIFKLMEFAPVKLGYYVAWGKLRQLDEDEFDTMALQFVEASLSSFWGRRDPPKSDRLNLKGIQMAEIGESLVAVERAAEAKIEIFPYKWDVKDYVRLRRKSVVLEGPIAAEEFSERLKNLLSE